MAENRHGRQQQYHHKCGKQHAERILQHQHKAGDGTLGMNKFGAACQCRFAVQKLIEFTCRQIRISGKDMEHCTCSGKGINTGGLYRPGNFIIVCLTDEKALHTDHGTAHHGVLIVPGDRHCFGLAVSCNVKNDFLSHR